MKNKSLRLYYVLSIIGIVLVSFYPLYMGIKVLFDMLVHGTVYAESYPKYIIPYTPISIAVILGVLLMPLLIRWFKRFALLVGSVASLAMFFASELLLESKVIVTTTITTTLESWQMFMCYIPPEGYQTRTWTEVDVLMGEYSPTFKIHFYLISVVLILSLLNCFYGFAHMINDKNENKSKKKALILQSVSSGAFLGLCIIACFTAFFRTGEITVSPLSAFLMCLFFVIFGITMGIYIGSFLLGKSKIFSILIPSLIASCVTLAMYIGEMLLLSGHLYRFGSGFLFDAIPRIVLAPIDIIVVALSGIITMAILKAINAATHKSKQSVSQ